MNIVFGDFAAANDAFRLKMLRGQSAARRRDNDALHLHAGHALGGVDGLPDRGVGGVHVDHEAVLHAQRALMANANDANAMRAPIAGRDRAKRA